MFQLWRLCVVFLCCCRRHVAVACPVCRRMYLLLPTFLPFFSRRRLWCGADGDRDFLFFIQIAIHRPGTIKIVIENPCRVHRNPSCSCQKRQLDTRLQTAQRRAHPLGKKYPFCSDQMIPSRESLTRTFFHLLLCAPLISYNCESACVFSVAVSASGLLIVCRVWHRRYGRSRIA